MNAPVRNIRWIAVLITLIGFVLSAVEFYTLCHPEDKSNPSGGYFWLAIGLIVTCMGAAEIFLGGRDLPRKDH